MTENLMQLPEPGDHGDHTACYFYHPSKFISQCINDPGWYYYSGYDAYIGPFESKQVCQTAYKERRGIMSKNSSLTNHIDYCVSLSFKRRYG
jgi:hypothetical protein